MKKIIFSDRYGLTQAVLEGRKTQTRRIAFKRDMEPPLQGITPEYIILVRSRYKLGETIAIAQSYKTIQEYLRRTTSTDLELKPELSQSKGYTNQMLIIHPDGQADSWQPSPEDIFAVDWKLVVPPTH